jgi:hypothetical protein
MTGAELVERHTRAAGRRKGALGHVAIEVLRELLKMVDWATGRLEPSIATLAERCKRSKSAVSNALKDLRGAGFVDWIRRYELTGRTGFGPQVQQTSSAYRLSLPRLARTLLALAPPPLPISGDLAAGAAERAAQFAECERQDKLFRFETTPLGGAIGRLGALVAAKESKRETSERNESPRVDLSEREKHKMSGVAAAPRPV